MNYLFNKQNLPINKPQGSFREAEVTVEKDRKAQLPKNKRRKKIRREIKKD